jgi:hypothetical protein
MICPSCKQPRLRPWRGTASICGIAVEGRGFHCDACGEIVRALGELERQYEVAADAIAARGIESGRELTLVRKIAELRAIDVAALLDVTPETVSRWEHDERPIPRLVAFTIGELYLHPKITRAKLEALAKPRPKPKR